MKKVFSVLLALSMVFVLFAGLPLSVYADAADFEYEVEELDDGGMIAIVTGYTGDGGEVVIPDTLGGAPVCVIDRGTFEDCTALTQVVLPKSLSVIEYEAFKGCTALAQIEFPENLQTIGASAFAKCSALDRVVIPENLTELGSHAFSECAALESITIPDSVVGIGLDIVGDTPYYDDPDNWANNSNGFPSELYIGNHLIAVSKSPSVTFEFNIRPGTKTIAAEAFLSKSCPESITIPEGVVYIGAGAFGDCGATEIILPETLTHIGADAFADNPLTAINLPEGLGYLGDGAFNDCTALQEIEIPAGLAVLGDGSNGTGVFSGCTALETVTLHEGLQVIENNAFDGCAALKSITLPDSLQEIGENAFGESGLTDITIPENVTELSASAFENCQSLQSVALPASLVRLGNSAFAGCTSLRDVTLPEGLTRIDSSAFAGCIALEKIIIPESVQLDGSVFEGCTALKKVNIPENTNEIGYRMFKDCTALEQVVLPQTVHTIGQAAFENCTSLTAVSFLGTVRHISEDAFKNCTALEEISFAENTEQTPDYNIAEDVLIDTAFYNDPENWVDGLLIGGGILFNADESINGRVVVPQNVRAIADGAFRDCVNVSEVTLYPGVTTVGQNAFTGCTSMLKMFVNATDNDRAGFMGWNETFALYGCPELTMYSTADYSETLEMVGSTVRFEKLNTMRDEETGVVVSEARHGAFLDGMELVAKEIERTENTLVYDLTMMRAGQIGQPETTVQVTIPLPLSMRDGNCKVYFIDAAGDRIDMNATQYGSVVVFYTDHFSEYVVEYTPAAQPGDVDFSGVVDVADILKAKALIMSEDWSGEEIQAGDLNGSGSLDVGDIMGIKNIIMGA